MRRPRNPPPAGEGSLPERPHGYPPSPGVARLMNLGPQTSRWLASIGVTTEAELRAMGSITAFRLLALNGHRVNILLIQAIEGALQGRHWNSFTGEEKAAFRAALAAPWDGRELIDDTEV